jgi:DNA-binding MarR family transcriptional regulator
MEVCMGQPLVDDLGFLLSRASGQVVRATNAALVEHGLRVRQYSVLVLACETADGLSQRELAAVLGLDPSQVVLLVDELAAAGLVERQAPEADRRTRLVVATEEGRRVREAAGQAADVAVETPLSLLGDAERERLRDMLTRIWTAAG